MASVRTPQEVAIAKAALVAALDAIETVPVSLEQATQLQPCKTLEEVHAVLTPGVPWNLALLSKEVFRDGFKGITPLTWACHLSVHSDVLSYLLGLPCMTLPFVLEGVSLGVVFEAGVPPAEHPGVGRGVTPLLAAMMDIGRPDATEEWQLKKCSDLLEAGADISTRTRQGCCLLHIAVLSDSLSAMKWAVRKWKQAFPDADVGSVPRVSDGETVRDILETAGFDDAEIDAVFGA